ncbi:hypothetical protein TRFO_26183 [Tritrichomonas foetus]|uniref:RING-type domain-containing protein n=1 Tax=Tritrichomonas foetus TaxID=1144522 RepID=A0A1J4K8Z6_9EUKA|nr:hypothetical protein TRFO_26183 [Tritrichomonas foetus]|eukprot:OHT05909.1 hypothetical protein TRFO_26183 [Tritrichomonas foetus]
MLAKKHLHSIVPSENMDLNFNTAPSKRVFRKNTRKSLAPPKLKNHFFIDSCSNDENDEIDSYIIDQKVQAKDRFDYEKRSGNSMNSSSDSTPILEEIDNFVENAENNYSEEEVRYLKKRLQQNGLILTFESTPIINDNQCGICIDNSTNSVVCICGHVFCQSCIDNWLKHSSLCPICQTNLTNTKYIKIRNTLDNDPMESTSLIIE